jgi:hypothetical protein
VVGVPNLKLHLHYNISTRRVDGLRVFQDDKVVGEISLEDLLKAAEEIKATVEKNVDETL